MAKEIINGKEYDVKATKTYTITRKILEGDHDLLVRRNDGFTSLELMGQLAEIQFEVYEQMKGTLRPSIVKIEVIED